MEKYYVLNFERLFRFERPFLVCQSRSGAGGGELVLPLLAFCNSGFQSAFEVYREIDEGVAGNISARGVSSCSECLLTAAPLPEHRRVPPLQTDSGLFIQSLRLRARTSVPMATLVV